MVATERGHAVADYRSKMKAVHGGLHLDDSHVFEIIDGLQRANGVTGDLLEIGAYQGRSAILLGYFLDGNEKLHICDRFDPPSAEDPDFLEGTLDYYETYGETTFKRNYGRFHSELPVLHVCSSLELHGRLANDAFRLIHLDGSHRREVLHSDIELSKKLLVDGGVIAFSAYRVSATLEVSAAVWAEVAAGSLAPIAATEWELYTTPAPPEPFFEEPLVEQLSAVPTLKVRTPPFGNRSVPLVGDARDRRTGRASAYVPPVMLPAMARFKRRLDGLAKRASSR